MARRKRPSDQQLLFDAPLRPEEPGAGLEVDLDGTAPEPSLPEESAVSGSSEPSAAPEQAEASGASESSGSSDRLSADASNPDAELSGSAAMLPLFPEAEDAPELGSGVEGGVEEVFDESGEVADALPEPGSPAPVRARLLAGLADLAVQAMVLVLLLVGEYLLGVTPSMDQWPPLLLFMAAFSYVYTVIPLAFWRQTPGMTCVSLICVSRDDQNLSFGQTSLRWIGAWVSLALVGLPILLALGGRSFSDWLSRSETLLWPEG